MGSEVFHAHDEERRELDIEVDFSAEIPPFALLQARGLIEPQTAALAARNASDEELQGIRAAFERNAHDNREHSHTHPGDRLFHIRIAPESGNPVYALMIQHLLEHRYGSMFQRLQAHYTCDDMPFRSEHEHILILQALQNRDPEAARQAMEGHLDEVICIFSRSGVARKQLTSRAVDFDSGVKGAAVCFADALARSGSKSAAAVCRA